MKIKHLVSIFALFMSYGTYAADYTPVQLDDLKVDIKTMVGKRIVTKGGAQSLATMNYLKDSPIDMNPVMMNIDSLPREDRKRLANGCQMVLCSGIFYGTIRKGDLGLELNVDKVTWK